MALKIISTSKVILILENPFLTSVMAYFIIGESITKHEILVFFMATIGIILLAQAEESKHSRHEKISDETIGIALTVVAAFLANLGSIALRQL